MFALSNHDRFRTGRPRHNTSQAFGRKGSGNASALRTYSQPLPPSALKSIRLPGSWARNSSHAVENLSKEIRHLLSLAIWLIETSFEIKIGKLIEAKELLGSKIKVFASMLRLDSYSGAKSARWSNTDAALFAMAGREHLSTFNSEKAMRLI